MVALSLDQSLENLGHGYWYDTGIDYPRNDKNLWILHSKVQCGSFLQVLPDFWLAM